MFQSLDECSKAWLDAGHHGEKKERIQRNLLWSNYYAYLANRQQNGPASFDPHAEEVVDLLFQGGLLSAGSSVLDIGSGTGAYALAFAARCTEVTALDMDESSLSVLQDHAAQLGLSNLTCVPAMWENYQPGRTFSFVFSSMCPAICNYEELTRMESLSERACGLIAVTRGSYDLHRKRLMELLNVRPSGGMTTEALWYYEALYLSGRHPNVVSYSAHYEYEIPIEEACRRNEIYFQIFGIPAEVSRPVIREYFESHAQNGFIPDETQLNTALISWKVG